MIYTLAHFLYLYYQIMSLVYVQEIPEAYIGCISVLSTLYDSADWILFQLQRRTQKPRPPAGRLFCLQSSIRFFFIQLLIKTTVALMGFML